MRVVRQVYRALGLVVALMLLACAPPVVFASSDPLIDALPVGGAGVGFVWRYERNPYKGAPSNLDNLPLYLYEGEHAFILQNDHEPRPLYYQFLHEREGLFNWEPIEQGPEVWRVRITRV